MSLTKTPFAARTQRLANIAEEEGVDALLFCMPVSMGYLQGFFEGSHERFMVMAINPGGDLRLICPALSANQASRVGLQDIRAWKDGEDPLDHFRTLVADWNLSKGTIAVENEMPAKILLEIQAVVPSAIFRPAGSLLSKLMRNKDADELALMRRAAAIADQALPAGHAAIKAGATENDVREALELAMRKLGGNPTFCIVATGPGSAEPHHLTNDTKIEPGQVILMDYGCDFGGYQSDITRIAHLGPASDEVKKVYDTVRAAHMAGRSAIRPGVASQSVDRATRKVIEDAGYGDFFVHRTGHGIGMQVHEEPYIVDGNRLPLEEGHCFSVEPGIYLPGKFGIRIENIVSVTEDGHESLNEEPSVEITEL